MAIGSIYDVSQEIRKITDPEYSGFEGFPVSNTEVADRWAEVMDVLGADITPPSVSGLAAKQAFKSIMLGANAGGIPVLISAVTAYGAALALGTLPTFASVPPIIPPVIMPTGVVTGDAELEATLLATALRVWIAQGTAVNTASGASIIWS